MRFECASCGSVKEYLPTVRQSKAMHNGWFVLRVENRSFLLCDDCSPGPGRSGDSLPPSVQDNLSKRHGVKFK